MTYLVPVHLPTDCNSLYYMMTWLLIDGGRGASAAILMMWAWFTDSFHRALLQQLRHVISNIRNNKMYNHSRYNDKWQVEIANITYLVLCCLFNTWLSIVYIYICLMNKQTIQRYFGYWKTIATVFLVCLAKIVTIRYRMSSLSSFKVTQVGVLSTNWHATIPYSV